MLFMSAINDVQLCGTDLFANLFLNSSHFYDPIIFSHPFVYFTAMSVSESTQLNLSFILLRVKLNDLRERSGQAI